MGQLHPVGNKLFQFTTIRQIYLHDLETFLLATVLLDTAERHVGLEERVVLLEIRLRNVRVSNPVAREVVLFHDLFDRCRVNRPAFFEQALDRHFHERFAHPGCQIKYPQIFTARPGRPCC